MPVRKLICCAALAFAVVAAGSWAPVERSAVAVSTATDSPDTITRYYSLTVRFRPFLLWMTRDAVGGARVSWSPSPGPDRWVELLVGSDPERAPMSINRWGFISEHTRGDTTVLTGIMTETDDESIDGARSNAAAMANGREFRVIRSTIRNGDATTSVGRLIEEGDVTYRRYAALLDRVPDGGGSAQHLRLAPGVEPGFLIALRGLVRESVETSQRAPRLVATGLRRDYVYAGKLYRLSLQAATLVMDAVVDGRSHGPAIEGEFEILNKLTGTTTAFRMLYGVAGADAETPLRLVYRPRWWVELELGVVDGADASRKTFATSELSPPRNPNIPRK